MSKVCERAAHTQFIDFLDNNSEISGLQSGNRKFHPTETALLHYTDQLLKNMDEKRISVVALLDMSKAFDSIQHDNLLSKLHLLGVSDPTLAWCKSYLSFRKQVVRIGSSYLTPFHWQQVWLRGPFSVQLCSHCTSATSSLSWRSAKPWAM